MLVRTTWVKMEIAYDGRQLHYSNIFFCKKKKEKRKKKINQNEGSTILGDSSHLV